MDARGGYKIKVNSLTDFSRFLEGTRKNLLRAFQLQYGRAIASEAARLIDLHRLGVFPMDANASPVMDATRAIGSGWRSARSRGQYHPELDFAVAFYFLSDIVLARVLCGCVPYRKAWESSEGVERHEWHEGAKPKGVPSAEWDARNTNWKRALGGPALARHLQMNLVETSLPTFRPAAVVRYLPGQERRIRAAARAIVLKEKRSVQPRGQPLTEADLKWLSSDSGIAALREAEVRVSRFIADLGGQEDLIRYGEARPLPTPRPAPIFGPRMIDHVDIVESSDRRIFIAVADAGLADGKRVFIHVGDAHLSVLQEGVQFGHVSSVPRLALDLLRASQTATLVEVEETETGRHLKAKHVALITNVGLSETFHHTLDRWRKSSSTDLKVGSVGWLEE